jgi:hypothetical protein
LNFSQFTNNVCNEIAWDSGIPGIAGIPGSGRGAARPAAAAGQKLLKKVSVLSFNSSA